MYFGQEKQIPRIIAVTPFSHPFHSEFQYDAKGVLLWLFLFAYLFFTISNQ